MEGSSEQEAGAGKASPFTIRKEGRTLKGFGTWRQHQGFDKSFSGLVVPKEPNRLVDLLTDDEIDHILKSGDSHTPTGSRPYGIAVFLLDSRPRISEVVNARLPHVNLETRQIWIICKGD